MEDEAKKPPEARRLSAKTRRTQVVTATPTGCQSITAGNGQGTKQPKAEGPERRGRLAPDVVAGVSLRQSEV